MLAALQVLLITYQLLRADYLAQMLRSADDSSLQLQQHAAGLGGHGAHGGRAAPWPPLEAALFALRCVARDVQRNVERTEQVGGATAPVSAAGGFFAHPVASAAGALHGAGGASAGSTPTTAGDHAAIDDSRCTVEMVCLRMR